MEGTLLITYDMPDNGDIPCLAVARVKENVIPEEDKKENLYEIVNMLTGADAVKMYALLTQPGLTARRNK